ncbi:hypothetical protein [Pseudoxanthomonas winnipegensis]|uniref:Uncharacterized protein n=1 Tax=Pseudoxanthomonas winnipegensis TaxID=2480810 RepID=A0A4Q8M2M3_9GAMM|nr:hypothetical protein [Pseudoxanthomonas winnipegensis]TAA41573.1 hypothetical protein EA655_11575 [Pseudoxanthomonas winnipegensis]
MTTQRIGLTPEQRVKKHETRLRLVRKEQKRKNIDALNSLKIHLADAVLTGDSKRALQLFDGIKEYELVLDSLYPKKKAGAK